MGLAWPPRRGRARALRRSVDPWRSASRTPAFAAFGFLIYVAIGGLIVIRRDGHLTGWLLILIGLAVLWADGLIGYRVSPHCSPPGCRAGVGLWCLCLFAILTLDLPLRASARGQRSVGQGRTCRGLGASDPPGCHGPHRDAWAVPNRRPQTVNPIGFLPEWMGYAGASRHRRHPARLARCRL